jgi:hypothetical protein
MTRKRAIAFAGLAVLATAAGALFFALTAGGSTHDISLDGVDGDRLAEFDVRLLKPDREAVVSAETAREAALATPSLTAGEVKETVLVRVVRGTMIPPIDTVAWAVNFDPNTVRGIPESGPARPDGQRRNRGCAGPPTFHVTFIDALTGQFLFSVQQAGEQIECPSPQYDGPTPVATPRP